MSFVKDNGGPIVVGGVVLAILTGYMELRMPSVVKAQLEDNGIVPKSEITAMKGEIEDNGSDINGIENRWNSLVDALAAQRVD